MPTLNWIGKEAVIKHHKDVPYRLPSPVPEFSCGDPGSGNLIVQGDNLHALKALLPRYAGQVKCIYIDPPYNPGNENWVYNDNVNSPEIRKWLGHVVGGEGNKRGQASFTSIEKLGCPFFDFSLCFYRQHCIYKAGPISKLSYRNRSKEAVR
jgi:hypothetical protein